MRRAQIFTIDFIISLVVFITILMTIISLWMALDLHIKEVESRREMHSISISVSDALIRSKGHPDKWNETNVQSIGLAEEEYVLSLNKTILLIQMNYDTTRSIMRLGNYQLFMYMSDINGYNVSTGIIRAPVAYFCRSQTERQIAAELNESGLVWDMYQAVGSDVSADYNERYYYRADDYGYTPEEMFDFMVLNLSNRYNTLIIEEPNVQNSAVNRSGVQQFLSNGGVLLAKAQGNQGFNIIEEGFGMHSEHLGSAVGIVNYTGMILLNVSIGDTMNFDSSSWRYYAEPNDSKLIKYVYDSAEPEKCLVCEWNYGKGRIYYVEDFEGDVNGQDLRDVLNFLGWQIKYGVQPNSSAMDVINIQRVAMLRGIYTQPVAVHIFIWR